MTANWNNEYHLAGVKVARETEKAICYEVNVEAYDADRNVKAYVWFPKSMMREGGHIGWFIVKKMDELKDSLSSRFGGVLVENFAGRSF